MFETIEIRRYTLQPGQRDTLVELFEREFIESQEACGMTPFGHYRDVDDPDAFVWFRGFKTFEARARCLEAFYVHGEVWRSHRDRANATMIDSDDVLMLRPAAPQSGCDLTGLERDRPDADRRKSFVVASTARVTSGDEDSFVRFFERELLDEMKEYGSRIGYFRSEQRPNQFPKLPVRPENVFSVLGVCDDLETADRWSKVLAAHHFSTMRLEPERRCLYR